MYVRGSAEHLPFADASFDAAIACLVFEHLPEHEPPIAEIARVLEPGGRFVFLLNHPLLQAPNSGWVIDHILEEEYWRIGPYLPVDVAMEELAPGVLLPFVHRPLSQYVNAMAAHGLAHRAHGRARAPRRLPRQSRRVPRRRDDPAPPPARGAQVLRPNSYVMSSMRWRATRAHSVSSGSTTI